MGACQTPGEKVSIQKPIEGADTLSLYLTYDISINSCLLAWEALEKQVMQAGIDGSLTLYASPFESPIAIEERARRFSFIAMDISNGSEQLIPMETITMKRIEDGFMIHQTSPFDGKDLVCGYVKDEDLMAIADFKSHHLLSTLERFEKFPSEGKEMVGSAVYTASMLLIDTVQKHLAWMARDKETIPTLDEHLQPITHEVMEERVMQMEDVLQKGGGIESKKVPVPEYDMWKGFMASGILSPSSMNWHSFGLLYHPNTKFGGFNPGKIVWFMSPADQIKAKDENLYDFLSMLAQNALLYSVDPTKYRSVYFTNNAITIDNGRYPNSHAH